MDVSRRGFLGVAAGVAAGMALARGAVGEERKRVPVIDVTDLYHPPQDPGDNVDLITAYGLPEIDLRAVVLDVTQRYRRPYRSEANPMYDDPAGGRDPGFIPVAQLNYIFDRNVPCAAGPFEAMRAPDDPMRDAPRFQLAGVELMLETLRESAEPVHIVSSGSARPVAVAYNREPRLMREKAACVHLCAGGYPAGYVEWNVQLDPHAFVCMLRSDLPVAIYPCATEKGAFDLGPHNTYWQLPDRQFIRRMDPRLQRYLAYAFGRSTRVDFLAAMEDEVPEEAMAAMVGGPHHVWETAVWAQVAGRKMAEEELVQGRVEVEGDGQFRFEPGEGNFRLYRRGDPVRYPEAAREAFVGWYEGFLRG